MNDMPVWVRRELQDGELAVYDNGTASWTATKSEVVRPLAEHTDLNCNDDDHDECLCFGRCACHWR
jgi:hypothetical protein